MGGGLRPQPGSYSSVNVQEATKLTAEQKDNALKVFPNILKASSRINTLTLAERHPYRS